MLDEDGYSLDGDLLDLEPVLRDALVLALPLAPLCQDGLPRACAPNAVRCSPRRARNMGMAAALDPRWAALQQDDAGRTGRPARAGDT